METIFRSLQKRESRTLAAVVAVLLGCIAAGSAAEGKAGLDGIYTTPKTFINELGVEAQGFGWSYYVLELQDDHFKLWSFGCVQMHENPINGKFSQDEGDCIELDTKEPAIVEKRYVATTIKGIAGIWPEQQLQAWKDGEFPTTLPILVRVADGPSGEKLDQTKFKYPPVTALFDKAAAKRFWDKEKQTYKARYMDVPQPLRTLLRQHSNRDDGKMAAYRKLILEQQAELDEELVKQLLAETGKGVSTVVGAMVLKDLFGHGSLFTNQPAFAKNDASKRAALQILANAMPLAKNSQTLDAALLTFLRSTGLHEIDHTCSDGTQVILRWKKNGTTTQSYTFSEVVSADCQSWANERLTELFGAK